MNNVERRKQSRRISDDCSQCEIWTMKIAAIEEEIRGYKKIHANDVQAIHRRIDSAVTRWVFIAVMAAYVGLASFNAVTGRNLIIEMTEARTEIQNIKVNVEKVERMVRR
jgi:hypothetical protein